MRVFRVAGNWAEHHDDSGGLPFVIVNRGDHFSDSMLVALTTDQQDRSRGQVRFGSSLSDMSVRLDERPTVFRIQKDDDVSDRLADGLRLRPTGHALSGRIEHGNSALLIDGYDGIAHRLHHGIEPSSTLFGHSGNLVSEQGQLNRRAQIATDKGLDQIRQRQRRPRPLQRLLILKSSQINHRNGISGLNRRRRFYPVHRPL